MHHKNLKCKHTNEMAASCGNTKGFRVYFCYCMLSIERACTWNKVLSDP